MRRAVILTTLALLLLAITGITLAGEGTIGTAGNTLSESTVQETTAATNEEPTATVVPEPTNTADEGSTARSEPAAGSVTENSTGPEVGELEAYKGAATEGKVENVGKPVGNGKARDGEGEARGGGGQEKVTLCHKDKNTIRVGEPAVAAHQSHEDSLGPCKPGETAPESPEETSGARAVQNGDGGGNGQPKVKLCHKGKTLTVGAPARAAHLRHGDTEGPCVGE